MSQMNPGVCEKKTERRIRLEYPDEVEKNSRDLYHHRFPRAESYHDVAVRLEPIILELEREQNDLLIIAHESVLRVLYGYLMACNASDIPSLSFPRDEIVEVRNSSSHPFCFADKYRSFQRATKMKLSVSRSQTCRLRSFQPLRKVRTILLRQVVSPRLCQDLEVVC